MGNSISVILDKTRDEDEETRQKTRQDLDILHKAVDSQLNEFEHKLTDAFLDRDITGAPGTRIMRRTRSTHVGIKDTPDEMVSEAMDSIFPTGSSGIDHEDALRDGFKIIVSVALNAILSNTDAGEHEENRYFVYVQRNTIVRLDVMLWRYNFVGKGFSDRYENVLGYVICTSVVDVGAVETDEFVYMISEHADDSNKKTLEYVEIMKNVYDSARMQKQGRRHLTMPVLWRND
ncbi:hypothetical protein F4820DRAFT_447293 [Hypoxylon rubiginosum]|uniref:Uncharacterized protein n=1 Tax=Hypoxylon rubiginosum TaxID=110542 RepID=A0ACB9Z312_9PEZI|nr:hypothetical protein F4820DRAFT_447293 [Hypoxylon rubiginosum]